MATMSEKPAKCFRTDALAPSIHQNRWRPRRGIQLRWPGASEGRYREARHVEELARSHSPQFLDRDSPGQHGPDSHRQERLRPGLNLHRLPADCGRRVERALRSDHHGRGGRYRSHAGRQRRLRFPRPTERRTSARRPPIPTRLCSISRPSNSACRRTSFPSRTASSREAARAFRTATSSRTSS